MEGHHPISPQKMTFRAIPSGGKVKDNVSLGSRRGDLVDIMPCGQTINSDMYIQTLKTL
jgi:hypothetical protein